MRVSRWLLLGLTLVACKPDADGDGFKEGDDCDDTLAAVSPDAVETCNGVDDNCDGTVDEGVKTTFYADVDVDGFGDANGATEEACAAPSGKVADSTDCDDADTTAHPGGVEVCGGGDEDCDGAVDDADSDVTGTSTFYADLDGDLYGDAPTGTEACEAPTDFVENDEDCDDGREEVNPGSIEVCDGSTDEDCDGDVDDADPDVAGQTVWYDDLDLDGFGDPDSMHEACFGDTTEATDCDDWNGAIHPGAPDTTCDGVDDNCDGGEAGLATFVDTSGSSLDASALLTGTAGAPSVVNLPYAGTLYLCEGTWYVSATIQYDFELIAPYGPDLTTLSGGNTSRVLHIDAGATNVSLSGVSIIEGAGGCGALDSYTSGTGLCCTTAATVTGDDLVIRDHTSSFGAVLVDGGCDLELTDSQIVDNTSTYAAAAGAVIGGTLWITDSEVSRNTASYAVGALYAGELTGAASLVLDGTVVEDNTATVLSGAVYSEGNGVIECYGDATSSAGFRRNSCSSAYAGAVWLSSGSFLSDGCDFVPDGDADDNTPTDIYAAGAAEYGDDASFTCTSSGCL